MELPDLFDSTTYKLPPFRAAGIVGPVPTYLPTCLPREFQARLTSNEFTN